MSATTGGNLDLVEELGGVRHYLDGEPVHAGDVLDYFDSKLNQWVTARFELVPGHRGRNAALYVANNDSIPVDSGTRLRWRR